jgi:hypothetical protein
VNDFVFYSTDPNVEAHFQSELKKHIKVDFMGDVDFFLGTAYAWQRQDDGHLSVHTSQAAFKDYASHRFSISSMNPVPNMSPYRSGMPINSIPSPADDNPDLERQKTVYQ